MSTNPYLNALTTHIPDELRANLDQFKSQCQDLTSFETLIRFTSGGDCPPYLSATLNWSERQQSFLSALKTSSQKRPREELDVDLRSPSMVKRTKISSDESANTEVDDDEPIFTLHSISVTSPIRKKVNISIHSHSINFTNPSTKAIESTVSLGDVKRAFLLPTRGKQKPHYTVIILTSDTPNTNRKGAATSSNTPQICFGVDATPSPAFTTTSHLDSPTQHPKGTLILDSLRNFLSHLPVHALPLIEPSDQIHTNATGSSGVEAYRSAKEGTLWFLKQGILWDSKPMEFWHLQDLVSTKGGGLRLLSATGRTCSVILKRKILMNEGDGSDEEDEEDGIDTDFGMVDGKEQDGITQWVKKYGPLFGRKTDKAIMDLRGKGKEVITNGHLDLSSNPMAEAESDLDDDNYATSDDSEDISASSGDESSESGDGNDANGEDESASTHSGGSDGSGEASEEEELRPENHPLLRPGAMPRMSRAAIDAVVGMVESDFLGSTRQSTVGGGEDDDDEEDELDE